MFLKKSNQFLFALAVACFFLQSPEAHAKLGVELNPIVGYERVQKLYPTRHTIERLTYGALLTVGIPLISLEAEYLRADDTEVILSPASTIHDISDRAKVGGRSRIKLIGFLSAWGRLGVQANRKIHELTVSGVTTRTEDPVEWDPYAGAGLYAQMTSAFAFNAGVTAIFTDWPNMNHNQYELTAGFVIRIGDTGRKR